MAATTTRVRLETASPDRGTTSIPATAARTAPSDQVAVATRSGDQPRAAAARWFSATADGTRPSVVNRVTAHRARVKAAAIPSR